MDYQWTEKELIEKIKELENKTVLQISKYSTENLNNKHKGRLGNHIQEHVFGIKPNSKHEADFGNLGIELKVVPLVRLVNKDYKYRAKERVVLSMINYMKNTKSQRFEETALYRKINKILYIFYEHDVEKKMDDYKIIKCSLVNLKDIEEYQQITEDFKTIQDKILEGKAEELSESITKILGACTKGKNSNDKARQPFSEIMAMKRAYSFKHSYILKLFMKYGDTYNVENRLAYANDETALKNYILKYQGMSLVEINQKFDNVVNLNAKARNSMLLKKILNVKKFGDLPVYQNNNLLFKTITVNMKNVPQEDIGLININIDDFNEGISFDDSEFADFIMNRDIFLIVFKNYSKVKGDFNNIKLETISKFKFKSDLMDKAKYIYNDTKDKYLGALIQEDVGNITKNNLINASDNLAFHIRPHAVNKKDKKLTPNNDPITKQQYWLNRKEVNINE